MIATCTGCQTRYRVAPEKLGRRGARIRCQKCSEVFHVAPPEPEEPERLAKAEPSAPDADAVPLSQTVRPTPRAKPTAQATVRPKPKPTATKIVKAAKRTPARKPAPK